MDVNYIPRQLFPVSEREINEQWAMTNYRYRCHFNSAVSSPIAEEGDIVAWRKEARSIADILKRDGIMYAEKEIISLCNTRYAEKFKNVPVTNIYEIVQMFDQNELLRDDYETYLDMLHMFQYGIFRCAYNAWAVDAASSWLKDRNLAYEPGPDSVKRKGKGFVYKLLVNRASNTLCVRFQKLSLRLHNEYVIVRDKKLEDKHETFNIVPHVFNYSYRGYIMRCRRENDKEQTCYVTIQEQNAVIGLVKKAIEHGETIENIKNILQHCIDNAQNRKFFTNEYLNDCNQKKIVVRARKV